MIYSTKSILFVDRIEIMDKSVIKSVLGQVFTLLVDKDYEQLHSLDKKKRLTAEEIKEGIEEYIACLEQGGLVTFPPTKAFDQMHIYAIGGNENYLLIEIYFWINGEESELTLKCQIFQEGKEMYFSVQDILVM